MVKREEATVNHLKMKEKGITLIVLVVTIIVLLILAGIAISLSIGNNGLFSRAKNSEEEHKKASIKEELELLIGDIQIDIVLEGKQIIGEELEHKLNQNGATVINRTDEQIDGEYKDYSYTIDKLGNITINNKLDGVRPTGETKIIQVQEGPEVEIVQIQVLAYITEGEIESIEPLNGAVLKTENSNSDKIYEVRKNGKYKFKVVGTNKRICILETEEITNMVKTIEASSILEGIEKIDDNGRVNIEVDGTITYHMRTVKIDGDVVLGEKLLINGEEKEIENINHTGNIYSVGSDEDVGTASSYAKNSVILKVNGNLTIEDNIKLTSVASGAGYGGAKGMYVYCTQTLTNKGEISMTARGAYAKGEDVYLWKNKSNNLYEYVPSKGADGGVGVWKLTAGKAGGNADTITETIRATGGGGSGGSRPGSSNTHSGNGGAGTSYSGGAGSGGKNDPVNHENGSSEGGKRRK